MLQKLTISADRKTYIETVQSMKRGARAVYDRAASELTNKKQKLDDTKEKSTKEKAAIHARIHGQRLLSSKEKPNSTHTKNPSTATQMKAARVWATGDDFKGNHNTMLKNAQLHLDSYDPQQTGIINIEGHSLTPGHAPMETGHRFGVVNDYYGGDGPTELVKQEVLPNLAGDDLWEPSAVLGNEWDAQYDPNRPLWEPGEITVAEPTAWGGDMEIPYNPQEPATFDQRLANLITEGRYQEANDIAMGGGAQFKEVLDSRGVVPDKTSLYMAGMEIAPEGEPLTVDQEMSKLIVEGRNNEAYELWKTTSQYEEAFTMLSTQIGNGVKDVEIVGHSLGGFKARMLSAEIAGMGEGIKVSGIGFNSHIVHSNLPPLNGAEFEYHGIHTDFADNKDAVFRSIENKKGAKFVHYDQQPQQEFTPRAIMKEPHDISQFIDLDQAQLSHAPEPHETFSFTDRTPTTKGLAGRAAFDTVLGIGGAVAGEAITNQLDPYLDEGGWGVVEHTAISQGIGSAVTGLGAGIVRAGAAAYTGASVTEAGVFSAAGTAAAPVFAAGMVGGLVQVGTEELLTYIFDEAGVNKEVAEKVTTFVSSAVGGAAGGAAAVGTSALLGAEVGSSAGPIGAAVGAAFGLAVAGILAIKKELVDKPEQRVQEYMERYKRETLGADDAHVYEDSGPEFEQARQKVNALNEYMTKFKEHHPDSPFNETFDSLIKQSEKALAEGAILGVSIPTVDDIEKKIGLTYMMSAYEVHQIGKGKQTNEARKVRQEEMKKAEENYNRFIKEGNTVAAGVQVQNYKRMQELEAQDLKQEESTDKELINKYIKRSIDEGQQRSYGYDIFGATSSHYFQRLKQTGNSEGFLEHVNNRVESAQEQPDEEQTQDRGMKKGLIRVERNNPWHGDEVEAPKKAAPVTQDTPWMNQEEADLQYERAQEREQEDYSRRDYNYLVGVSPQQPQQQSQPQQQQQQAPVNSSQPAQQTTNPQQSYAARDMAYM